MRMRPIAIASILLLAAASVPSLVGQAPERTFGGQTLQVPDDHMDMGEVYYVWPGIDNQLVFRSSAPNQQVVVSTTRAVGYMVAPFEREPGSKLLLAGAVRIPAASLRSGTQLDQALASPMGLNVAEHDEMAFVFTGVDSVETLIENEEESSYKARILGSLHYKGQSKEISFEARLAFRPYLTFGARNPRVGDRLIISGQYTLQLADFGWETRNPLLRGAAAPVIPVDIFLMLSTVSPETPGNPLDNPANLHARMRFMTFLRDFNDPKRAYEYGNQLLKDHGDNAQVLQQVALIVAQTPGIARRDLGFARKAAQRALDLSQGKSPGALAALATISFVGNDVSAAVEWQRKAIENAKGGPPRQLQGLNRTLARYEQAMGKDD